MTRGRALVRAVAARFGLLAGSVVVAMGMGEGIVRLLAPQNLILLRPDLYGPDTEVGWHLAPRVSTMVNTGGGAVRVVTDARGHRIAPDASKGEPCCRVLAIGDSFLEALQVEGGDVVTARLTESVSARLGCVVVVENASAAGWGPSHYRYELQRELMHRRPDMVVIFLFAGNDMEVKRLDVIPPRPSRERHRLRLPRSLRSREMVDAVMYPVNDLLETRSHLFQLVKKRGWLMLMRLGLSARYFPDVLLKREADSPRWQVTADVCGEMAAACAARGIPCIFVLLPGVYQVDTGLATRYASALGIDEQDVALEQPSLIMSKEMRDRRLVLLDMLPELRKRTAEGARLYGEVDTHLSIEGHRVLAEILEPEVAVRLGCVR